jgi:hypothetical protein
LLAVDIEIALLPRREDDLSLLVGQPLEEVEESSPIAFEKLTATHARPFTTAPLARG